MEAMIINIFNKCDYMYYLRTFRLHKIITQFFFDCKCCVQRIQLGYCDKDVWSIDSWFLETVPGMLQQLKNTRSGNPGKLGENYTDEHGILCNDTCHAEWDKILDRLIFLLHEANEETCQKKSPDEDEWDWITSEFAAQYGPFGEKLEPDENKDKNSRRIHFPDELPQYKDIIDKYHDQERELAEYRDRCKNEALELFSK